MYDEVLDNSHEVIYTGTPKDVKRWLEETGNEWGEAAWVRYGSTLDIVDVDQYLVDAI